MSSPMKDAHIPGRCTLSACNNHIVGRVMINNGSALNVCPVTTLKQMNVDLNRVRPSKTAVRAFDGSRREVNGEINLLIEVDSCSFSITFQVLDIPNAFSLLLGRPWIHSAGAVPSSLHQKLKFIRLITVKGEEDYAIYKETVVPYISVGNDENLPFHSFETVSVIWDYGEIGPTRADRMIGKVLLRHNYIPGTSLGARGQGINHPIEVEEYKHRRELGFRPSCHEIIEARRGNHLRRLPMHYGRLNRGVQVPPLLHSNPNHRHVDLNPSEECLGEPRPIYFGEGLDEDNQVPEIEESLHRLKDRRFTSVEPMEEINVGTEDEPRNLKIGTGLDPTQRARMIDFLTRYQEVFAWSYADMSGLDPSIVKHFLPLDTEKFPPKRQQLRRQRASLLLRIKEEVVKQINADKCQPLFRLLRKNTAIEWNEECQKAFNTIKAYLVQPPVLVPPTPGRPLILYLTVRRQSLGCMLGQEEESTHTEHAIYYLSKKFTDGESNYPEIEKMCCALVWVMQRLRRYTLYHTIRLLSKADPLKYLLDSPSSMRNIAKWRCQLTEYDIEYVSRTSVKGQVIADHLAEFPIEDNTPIDPNFPDEGILQVDDEGEKPEWKMYFDGAVNSIGSDIGAVLISPNGRYYPVEAKIDFPCTNNVAEYEACILGLQAAIDFKVKELEVFGDSMLTIFQTLGQWKTKDAKLVPYHENFEEISFTYTPRMNNQFADALATLPSMVSITKENLIEPLEIEITKGPAHSNAIEASEAKPCVRTRMWTLVGARIARFWIARLGSVHLPVGTRDGHA
ncbi:hypothetical protein CRG98_038679 [Punica granatum]|uniref:G-patch domain-containing protein n=1 Tax=Punica granatum TaxID=22663 RepID=A0A2I0IAC4_PUNGR|nr:hypothetical protein CRG98_038679 [Punica granatum]